MKRFLLLLTIILAPSLINAQFYFQEISNSGLPAVSQGSSDTADVDSDGDLDIFITGNNNGVYIAKLYLNDGNGFFSESNNTFIGVSLSTVRFFDSDNDNNQDIIYLGFDNSFNRITKLYKNDGNGNFTEDNQNSFIGITRGDITVGDIDGDNDNDLLLTGEIGAVGITNLYLNNGSGDFTLNNNHSFPNVSASNCEFNDIDGDNDLDLLITGYSNSQYLANLYLNNGSGSFTEQPIHQFSGYAFSSILFVDIDNDLDDDVIITGRVQDNFLSTSQLHINLGGGFFTFGQNFDINVENGSIDSSDLNNDGYEDIIISGYQHPIGSKTNLYLNNGNGAFNIYDNQTLLGVYDSRINLLEDIDNDGDDDLFIIGGDFNTPSVYGKIYRNAELDILNHPDYNALVTLYNSLDGNNWYNNINWLDTTKPLSEWYGITEIDGRVTSINLRQNNLTGSIPNTIGDLTSLTFIDLAVNNLAGDIPTTIGNIQTLEWLDLAVNNLTGSIPNELTSLTNLTRIAFGYNNLSGVIPNFTSQNLLVFTIDNNKFQFGDFEGEFITYQNNITQFLYTPQQNPDENFITEQTLNVGDNVTLNAAPINGTNTFYQWYFEGSPIDGATSTTLELQNLQLPEMGVYQCYAFNSTITGLTLRTAIHTINRINTLHPEYNDLVAFYNATNGDNWINNTNWLTDAPINTWYGISTLRGDGNSKVTSIYLNNNNLTGSIPDEIGNFSNLFNLELGGNNISGNVPQSITNLTELGGLALQANNLNGDFPDLTALPLNYLYINFNNFKFTDIADEFSAYESNIPNFFYTPQYTADLPVETNANVGDDITLTLSDIPSTAKGMTKKTKLVDNSYQWYKDDVALTINANSNTYTINNAQNSDSGIYHCEITNADVPEMIVRRQPITLNIGTLSIKETILKLVSLYPNPVKNVLNIRLNNSENANAQLYDINGRLILKQKLSSYLNTINIESLSPNIYILKIETHNKTITKRIIKQ